MAEYDVWRVAGAMLAGGLICGLIMVYLLNDDDDDK